MFLNGQTFWSYCMSKILAHFCDIKLDKTIPWFWDEMVANLELRTYELIYEEFGNIFGEILFAWEKAECYGDLASHSLRIFTLFDNNNFRAFLRFMTKQGEKYRYVENGCLSIFRGRPLNIQSFHLNYHTDLSLRWCA